MTGNPSLMKSDLEYAGFWIRCWAATIDTVLICMLTIPVLSYVYGDAYWSGTTFVHGPVDVLVSWVLPTIAVIWFWYAKQATPGKMAVGARIVDARTGGKPSTRQLVLRYVGYLVATLPLCLGFFWIGFDQRKQGWHDKIAGTVVVRNRRGALPVQFDA